MRKALLLLAAITTPAFAQTTPHPEDLATVTGHITCADTQRPARLAEVRLVPANVLSAKDLKHGSIDDVSGNMLPAVQTDLTGGYTTRNVRPGQYYLRADLRGYVDPLLSFTRDDLANPTPEMQQRIQRELQLITVAPHSTLTADATLRRGASISGTVTFDDGTPGIGLSLQVLQRDAKGIFSQTVRMWAWSGATDDHGRYRFTSLPPGEYAIEANLNLTTEETTSMPVPTGHISEVTMMKLLFTLPIYSGSAIRRREAKPIKLEAGEEASDFNITIPISQLHDVSGTLLAKDGHTINGGDVALLFADDRSQFAVVQINPDDATFHFPYVPEGNYILSVQEAKDVGRVEVPNAPGATPRTHTEHPTLHTYGTTEQPLAVQTDLQSLNITVPDQTSVTAPANPSD